MLRLEFHVNQCGLKRLHWSTSSRLTAPPQPISRRGAVTSLQCASLAADAQCSVHLYRWKWITVSWETYFRTGHCYMYLSVTAVRLLTNFHQHVSCPTRGPNTLDHCYSQFKNAYKARSLPAFGKSDHAAIFLTPEYKQRLAQEPPVKREVTRWSSHSEAMLQAALDDVDWDMFRASSSDVSEFTDVAVSFVNTLTEQATETITVRTFPNQKPWVDRSIRDAVNKRTAAYNEGIWAWEYERVQSIVLCSQTSSKCRQTSLQRENWVSFSAQWLSTHVAGIKDHLCLWEQILRGGECRSVAGRIIKHLLRPLWLQRRQRGSAEQRVRKQQTEKRESCDHRVGGRGSEGTKGSEHQESGWTWRDHRPGSEIMRWSACWFVHFYLQRVPCYLCSSHLL